MIEKIKKAETDLDGLFSVLADNLYSTPEVAIRELIQNAHDAITRRKIEDTPSQDFRIDVVYNTEKRIVEISDNGSGLTEKEIELFLATIARGYTRKLRTENDNNQLIGFFGLGFLSAYVIVDKIEFITCSYQSPDQTKCFSSRKAGTYTILNAPMRDVGSTVRLHLKKDFAYLADYSALHRIINYYCTLLDVPIYLGDYDEAEPINHVIAPWKQPDSNPIKKQKELMAFCTELSRDFAPLCVIEIPPGKSVSGVLWLHDTGTYGTSDNRRLSVYLRGMLLADNDRDLLPGWAGFVSGIINSNNLTPTASRETLKKNELYLQIRQELKEILIDGLLNFSNTSKETWRQIMRRHNEALRGAALADDTLFESLRDKIKLPTNKGDYTILELLERSNGDIYISLGEDGSAEEVLFTALNIPIVKGYMYAALAFCSTYTQQTGGNLVVLGDGKNENKIFQIEERTTQTQQLLDFLVNPETEEGILARFEPNFMPLIKIPNRKAILKHEVESDEADQRISKAVLALARHTVKKIEQEHFVRVYINLSSPIIEAFYNMPEETKRKSAAIIKSFCDIPMARDGLPIKPEISPYQSFFENLLGLLQER